MSASQFSTRITLKGDTYANWSTSTKVLLAREIGIDTTNNRIKIGDGTSTWANLDYIDDVFVKAGVPTLEDKQHGPICLNSVDGHFYILTKTEKNTTTASDWLKLANYQDITDLDANLSHHYYEGALNSGETVDEAAARLSSQTTSTASYNDGDTLILKDVISGQKTFYTAYVYNNGWNAMNGNYNADNVFFDYDLIITNDVGVKRVESNGMLTLSTNGKSVKEVFNDMFQKEEYPTKTSPTITIKLNNSGVYEVGTSVTPQYTTTFTAGAYTYNASNVTASNFQINVVDSDTSATYTAKNDSTSGTYTNTAIIVGDSTNYKLNCTVTYSNGAIPKTNLGNNYDENYTLGVRIGNSSTETNTMTSSNTSSSITGYRGWFCGSVNFKVITTGENDGSNTAKSNISSSLTSSIIRGLTKNKLSTTAATINANSNTKAIVIAVPSNKATLGENSSATSGTAGRVILTSSMNTTVGDMYKKYTSVINVEGNNGYTAIAYDLWVYQPTSIDAGEVHSVSLKVL